MSTEGKLTYIVNQLAEAIIAHYNLHREIYDSYTTVLNRISELRDELDEAETITDEYDRSQETDRIQALIHKAKQKADSIKLESDSFLEGMYRHTWMAHEFDLRDEVQDELYKSRDFIYEKEMIYL